MAHNLMPSEDIKVETIGNENPEDFFSISGRSVSKGGTLLPRVGFTAPSEARAVIEIHESALYCSTARIGSLPH